VPLLEISKIFPDLGAKAAALLAQAPHQGGRSRARPSPL
jgi:hypothetical protein